MATNLDRTRKVYVSAQTAEATYDGGSTPDTLLKVDSGVIPQEAFQTVDDRDLIGGTEEPSDLIVVARSTTFPIAQVRCRPHTLGFMAGYALGDVATTTPSGGSTARKHTITPRSALTLPTFEVQQLLKTGTQLKYTGLMMDGFTLTIPGRQSNRFCVIAGTAMGSGTVTTDTDTATEPSEGALNAATGAVWLGSGATYLGTTGDDLDLTVEELGGSPSDDADNIVSVEWQYRNNLDPEFLYQIGSGQVFGTSERQPRDQTVIVRRIWDGTTHRDAFVAQTDYALQFKVKNAQIASEGLYYGFNLIFPDAQVTDYSIDNDGGRLVETLTYTPLEDATYGSVVLDVFNTFAGYAQ